MKPTIVSLFSGLGGIDEGFRQAGFKTVVATDIWGLACESLQENFQDCEVIVEDIQKVDFKRIKKKYGSVDGVIGGPPCPSFSKSRFYRTEKNRGLDDENGLLTVSHYFKAIEILKPRFFFFENVHGFIYKPHQSALEYVQSESTRLGFKIFHKVVNAADYGVPQTRERFICIGIKNGLEDFIFPEPTHSSKEYTETMLHRWVTCGDILNDIDQPHEDDAKMIAGSKHKDILSLIPPGDNYLFFTQERKHPQPLFKWRSRYWSFLLKLSPDRPSWTIQASHSNNMGPFHWRNRFLRILEIKRIQSFSDNYIVNGNFKEKWRQIGNAVPPKLAYHFAKKILSQYYKNECN